MAAWWEIIVWRDAFLVAGKDLRIELRARVTLTQVAPLGVLILVVFAFAFNANTLLLTQGAAGLYWVAVIFGAVLVIQRSFDVESDDGNQDALRLSGIEPGSIFLGKAMALAVQLLVLQVVLWTGLVVFFDVGVSEWPLLVCAGLAGTTTIAVCGTLYGALAAGVSVRDTLLPLLLLPVLAPALLAGTRAFEAATGVTTDAGWNWTGLLFVMTAVYTAAGLAAFGPLVEDG